MDAKVTWQGSGMAFEGTASKGVKLALGSGEDPGFSPLELLLVGLGGCTGMDVISILQKKRQDVSGFEIQVHAERAEDHPKVFTDVVVEYIVSGKGLDPQAVERAVDLSVTKYCSAQAMLSKAANITHKITIREA